MDGRPSPVAISTRLDDIATLASRHPKDALTTLAHHIDESWLLAAWLRTRKDGATGVDGQTAEAYAENLSENLSDLLDRFKSGRYRAPPVRRVHIPKGDGRRTRPIGIPTLEDKVLQRAVAMVLEAVYEPIFSDASHGFRPHRSAHQALEALWRQAMDVGGGWIIELDIQSFFDHVDHRLLNQMLDERVRDGVIRRAIGKWLNAGVMEAGEVHHPDAGTPQGGVVSPILANIYLHVVLDRWFEQEVRPRLWGRAFMVRYADDAVLGFANEADARRVMAVLPKRFARFGLSLHPEKTRLLGFKPPRGGKPSREGEGAVRSFDFLGFTHFWKRARRGGWVISRKTAKDRYSRALRRIGEWCRKHRHEPVGWQHRRLSLKLHGTTPTTGSPATPER